MTYHSSKLSDGQIEMMVDMAEQGAYLSRRDGCRVTLARCVECSRLFEEELSSAVTKIKGGVDLLCLACDDDAVVSSLTGVTIQVGWFSD